MEEIYQAVWCQVFAATCVRLVAKCEESNTEEDPDHISAEARIEANWAAGSAVHQWDESVRRDALVAKNKENP